MLADVMATSETQKRIIERRDRLLGEIGILDWQIKQLSARQAAKYNEIEAMLREQPFIQQLELDLIQKYRDTRPEPLNHHHWQGETGKCVGCGAFKYGDGVPDECPNPFRQPQQQEATGVSQSETLQAPVSCYETPLEQVRRELDESAARRERIEAEMEGIVKPARRKKAAAKRPAKKGTKKAAAKKPATPKPVPVAAAPAEAPPSKRGRGRPRKHPPVAAVPPPEGVETAHPGNGANDLDAAFGAM